MNSAGGLKALLQQLVTYVTDAFHDPSTLLRLGIWGAVGVCALILVLFVIPVGLLCLAYYMISHSKKRGAAPGEDTEIPESTSKTAGDDTRTLEE